MSVEKFRDSLLELPQRLIYECDGFLKQLAVSEREKRCELQEFFNPINYRNTALVQILKNVIKWFNELVENEIIQNEVEIIKMVKIKDYLIHNFNTSDITRRIKYIKFYEIL